ncbi:hypothetical protein RLEG3_11880 [Rhizobium leguminosarum bv. trifolii WSM1689]|uniref:hypothetical protein n=1 Tax=Rhizobium leguminosarum TaxID=384 RepID=UPI0003E0A818|nr:hypothetical protein [Rhizobium leguminosarum]AHF86623.1 hypothetical protein RLEG3_11880 [Rhizobium leguminosarum bv. trifolii WSM1689]
MTYAALKIPKFLSLLTVLAAGLLSGCARMPPVFSDDGATILFKGEKFKYQAPGQAAVSCEFDDQRKLAVCDNGLTSELVTAGLPFHGVVLVEFDGRRFRPAEHR